MPIAQLGQVNIAALSVPQALVQIVPPQYLTTGVPTNVSGYVGTASWGPVDLPVTVGNYSEYNLNFGPTINRLNDMGGHIILAQAQGAAYFVCVRVTDGTDTAASGNVMTSAPKASGSLTFTGNPANNDTVTLGGTTVTFVTAGATGNQVNIGANAAATIAALVTFLNASTDVNISKCTYSGSTTALSISFDTGGTSGNSFTLAKSSTNITLSGSTLTGGLAAAVGMVVTGKYSGSLGNNVTVNLLPGTAANSWKLVILCSGLATEIFDNIGAGLSGTALWAAIANAINNGTSGVRPPSNILIATAGSSTYAPTTGATTLSGGTDGINSITTSTMIGVNATPRTGMYALQGAVPGIARFTLCDNSDPNSWSPMAAFALSIGAEGISSTVMSDSLLNAYSELENQGVDTYAIKVIFGDWVVWLDTVNNVPYRVTSPAAIAMGIRGNLSPEESLLNKPILGIVGTQSSILNKTYSYADYQTLAAARMDVIALDPTVSNSFIFRLGQNTSSNPVTDDDSYTDVTNFLAKSIVKIAAYYLGKTQTPTERRQARVSLIAFLQLCVQAGIIGTADGSQAYQVVLDNTNNSQATVALGYQFAYVKAIYFGIVKYFVISLEGGASVTISDTPSSSTIPNVLTS